MAEGFPRGDDELLRWRLAASALAADGDPRAGAAGAAVEELAGAHRWLAAVGTALATARRAAGALDEAGDELSRSLGWSLLDLLTSPSRWADLFEHDRLDRSGDDLGRARFLLGRLRRQLADLEDLAGCEDPAPPPDGRLAVRAGPRQVPANPYGAQVGEGWRWLDTWFDNALVDLAVGSELGRGRAEIADTARALADLITRLQRHHADAGWRVEALREQVRTALR